MTKGISRTQMVLKFETFGANLSPIVAVLASPLPAHLADQVITLLLVASPLRDGTQPLLPPLNLPLQQLQGCRVR